ncbi:hypothetical protein [Tunicatimonas pelagia]|uniref:hypothetical protein n=1 Tax=Tunicatimonas pelagia TaxID=931531 RepID=UPI002665B46D|nr:hypothetical protein [Tunicatimonas pelagia]WKN44374.1 hypothetical protein P0M28_05270 [Tunicatimonas pelagia]
MIKNYRKIVTMNNQSFFSFSVWKFWFVASVVTSLFFVSSFVYAQTSADIQGIEQYLDLHEDQKMYLVIRASLQRKSLEKIADEFGKRGVNIAYRNIEYNAENLLTHIKMEVTIGNCESADEDCYRWQEEAYNNGQPLDKNYPFIFYLYREGRQVKAAGLSYGYPENLPKREIRAMKNMTGSIVGNLTAD